MNRDGSGAGVLRVGRFLLLVNSHSYSHTLDLVDVVVDNVIWLDRHQIHANLESWLPICFFYLL